jgi:hypothetical protein
MGAPGVFRSPAAWCSPAHPGGHHRPACRAGPRPDSRGTGTVISATPAAITKRFLVGRLRCQGGRTAAPARRSQHGDPSEGGDRNTRPPPAAAAGGAGVHLVIPYGPAWMMPCGSIRCADPAAAARITCEYRRWATRPVRCSPASNPGLTREGAPWAGTHIDSGPGPTNAAGPRNAKRQASKGARFEPAHYGRPTSSR